MKDRLQDDSISSVGSLQNAGLKGFKNMFMTKLDSLHTRSSSLRSEPERQASVTSQPAMLEEPSDRLDDDSEFLGMSDVRKEALTLLSTRKAAAVAIGSLASLIDCLESADIEGRVRLLRQRIDLESCILAAEHALFDKVVVEMDHDEKVRTICELIDQDGDGVDVDEIFDALYKIKNLKALDKIIPLAEEALDKIVFSNRLLTTAEFDLFLKTLAESVDCTFNDLVQLLISQIVFHEDGRSILEDFVNSLETGEDDESFNQGVLTSRMLLVFDTMDYQHDGTICFKEVVKHLSRFTADSMIPEQRQVLLSIHEDENRHLQFAEFTELILNIVAVCPSQLQFHEIANAMTLSICRQDVTDEDIMELFLNYGNYENAIMHQEQDESELRDILSFGKLNRLFDLLDLSRDGNLDMAEIALFLRKYQSNQVDMRDTIQETIDSILEVDHDCDKKLDKRDFAILVSRLAHGTGVQVHRFIDFLVVQSALKDDDAKDRTYVETYLGLNDCTERENTQCSLRKNMKRFMSRAKLLRTSSST